MIAKKLTSGKTDQVMYVTSESRPQLVVRTKGPRARRRQYSYVEAVTKLDHGLSQSDLSKAYKVAGTKFENLKKTFIVLDDSFPDSNVAGPVSEVAAGLAGLEPPGAARSTSSSHRHGYFTQVHLV